jgi:ssDNA-binding Zn-finger/Zn-ribbon topoisomerase 1
MFDNLPKGAKRLAFGPRYCPKCTKIINYKFDYTYAGCSYNPVFLIKKQNKKTKDWFWGCPNFSKCKYSENRAQTKVEKDIKIRAWANSLCGPHF